MFIYNGGLSDRTVEYIESAFETYSYALEIKQMPANWLEWIKDNLLDYSISNEDCQGNVTTVLTKAYCQVWKGSTTDSIFLFLKSLVEKKAVIEAFPELIVDKEPFKIIIDGEDITKKFEAYQEAAISLLKANELVHLADQHDELERGVRKLKEMLDELK